MASWKGDVLIYGSRFLPIFIVPPDSARRAQQKEGLTDETHTRIDITGHRCNPDACGADYFSSVRR